MLLAYDVLSIFCRFETIYFDGQRLEGCAASTDGPRHHRPRLHGGQLRLHLVPETGALPAALFRHYVFAQEAWRRAHTWSSARRNLPFKAHAWVEVDGRAVNERSNVQATYAVWDRC